MADTFFGGSSQDVLDNGSGDSGIGDLVTQIGGALLSGAKYLNASDNIKDQKAYINSGLAESAKRLNQGYDTRQLNTEMGLDELTRLLTQGLKESTNLYRNAAYDYGQGSDKAVDKYAASLLPQLNQYAQGISGASDLYGAQLDDTAGQVAGTLQEGADDFEQQLAGYTGAGDEALGVLRGILASNPNELTPEQRYLVQDYLREAQANLAASGLRGAGRAGVAAINDGLGRTRAQLFKQNQDRRDAAAIALNNQGYSANTNIANTLNNLKRSISDLQYKTGTTKAGNAFDVNSAVAKAAYGLGQDVGTKRYNVAQNNAQTIYNTDKGIGDTTNQFYTNLGNIASERYTKRGDTAVTKANVDASTGQSLANNNAAASNLLSGIDQNALNQLSTYLNQQKSATAKGL